MFKFSQITLFFLIDGSINELSLKNLCRCINNLEIKADIVFDNFDKLIAEDKITKIQDKLNETKEILRKDIILLLDRGEKLDQLISKTNELKNNADIFKKKQKNYKIVVIE